VADLAHQLDAAVDRLPERFRRVFVACELQATPLADVAARLRCPVGTVASRLARARERVRARLLARGVVPGLAGGLAALEIVPPEVRAAAVRVTCGRADVRPGVAALARRASRQAPSGVAASLAAGLVAVAVALGVPDERLPNPKPPAKDSPPAVGVRTDAAGVPLPDGALARLGSARFRHGGPSIGQAAFSGDGRQLAAGDSRGVHVWDVATGRRVWHFPLGERRSPSVIRFLEGGVRLAVGSTDYRQEAELAVYDLATGKVADRTPFRGRHQTFVQDVTPDGARVLVNARFDKVYLWDRAAGKEVWAVETPDSTFALPITADGKRVALARTFGAVLRDAATGEVVGKFPDPVKPFWNGHTATLGSDGRLAVCSYDQVTVGVYEAGRADPVHTFRTEWDTTGLFFSPDARYLAGCGDGMTRVWDLKAPAGKELVARLPGTTGGTSGTPGAFAPDGKTLALDVLGGVSLWRVGEWTRLSQSADPGSGVLCVRFAPDGKRVFGYTAGGWLAWPTGGGPGDHLSDDTETDLRGLADVSADGRVGADVVYKPATDGKPAEYALRVTDLRTGKDRRIPVTPDAWRPVAVSDDGRFVCRYGGKEFVVWDAASGEVVFRQKRALSDRFVVAAQLTGDGRGFRRSLTTIPSAGGRPGVETEVAVFVTDHVAGREWKMDPAPLGVTEGRFSPDGTRLAVRGDFAGALKDGAVSVWDTASGRRLCAVPSRSGYPHTFALSADGRALVVGSNDGTVRFVEVATDGERVVFRHEGPVLSVAFHPDGTRAVSSSPEAPVYVWDLLGEPGRWDPAKADAVWADLQSTDAKVAFAAVRALRARPEEAVAFLKDRVRVPATPADYTVVGWLTALDAPTFADRERAQRDLTAAADLVRPRLEAARKGGPSAEAARRLDQVLKSIDDMTPERARYVRACEVLEGNPTPEAIRVLRTWAGGPAGARLITEAKESLDRLRP
jgi:WD40 repeat protein